MSKFLYTEQEIHEALQLETISHVFIVSDKTWKIQTINGMEYFITISNRHSGKLTLYVKDEEIPDDTDDIRDRMPLEHFTEHGDEDD